MTRDNALPTRTSRPTIFQVAEAAGVSITTVSHVFSGKRQVHQETRQRVLEAAERLGYRPRSIARALATGRSMTLGLEITTSAHELVLSPFFSMLLPAMSATAIELGYSFVFVPPEAPSETFVDPLVAEGRIDAAVIVDPVHGDPFLEALLEYDLPFASVGRLIGSDRDTWVDNDAREVVASAVAHLRQQGYARPALLTVERPFSFVPDYDEAFRSLVPDGLIYVAADLSEQAATQAIGDILGRPNRPDAVVCVHDRFAVGTVRAAEALGIAVPAELGVVSAGESVLTQQARTPITAVNLNVELVGQEVVRLADELVRGVPVDAPRIVRSELIPRESTRRSV